jgi:hypothetical protein
MRLRSWVLYPNAALAWRGVSKLFCYDFICFWPSYPSQPAAELGCPLNRVIRSSYFFRSPPPSTCTNSAGFNTARG